MNPLGCAGVDRLVGKVRPSGDHSPWSIPGAVPASMPALGWIV